jgi:hypothetical protein
MVALALDLALATWLLVSAFVLPQSSVTAWNALLVAFLVAAIAFLAFSMPGKPGLRYVNTVVAAWLFAAVFWLPHVSGGTVLHDVFVALGIALVSIVPPFHHGRGDAGRTAAHASA